MNLESLGPVGRERSPRARRFAEGMAALSALFIGADALGVRGLRQAAAAPQVSASADPGAVVGDVGFDELPNLLAIEPADGAVDAALDGGAARLMASRFSAEAGFSAPADLTSASPAAAPAYAGSLSADVGNGPQLAVDSLGRALAVWVSATGGVWCARFE